MALYRAYDFSDKDMPTCILFEKNEETGEIVILNSWQQELPFVLFPENEAKVILEELECNHGEN